MRYLIIDAAKRETRIEDHEIFDDAKRASGLDPKATDHGSFGRGLGYVVYEYGLFEPKERQHYLRVGNTLIAGNMVVYAYDAMGETVDVTDDVFRSFVPNIAFFADCDEIETAIKRGIVRRPQMKRGDEVLWTWPNPKPEFMKR